MQLIEHKTEVHGKLTDGPVDDPDLEYVEGINCPNCGRESLIFYPSQEGYCYSGKFRTRILLDHYYCPEEDCEGTFIKEATQ